MDFVRNYGTAIAAVALTVALKLLVDGLGNDHPFVLLPAPVAIAAWYGGRGPGLLAVSAVVAAGVYFVSWQHPLDLGDLVAVSGLAFEGALIVWITAGLREARGRAEQAERELRYSVAVRDETLGQLSGTVRGPLANLETTATDALRTLEREGYRGSAVETLRSTIDHAARLKRATAGLRDTSVRDAGDPERS